MVTSVAILVCPNGLGHARRSFMLAKSLIKLGAGVTLIIPRYVSKYKLAKITSLGINIEIIDVISVNDWLIRLDYFLDQLKFLKHFDHVVSDNLVEILRLRSDAWLSGSFLWHETGHDWLPDGYVEKSRRFLNHIKPRIISSSLFSSDYLHEQTVVKEVGLYSLKGGLLNSKCKKDSLLISCGLGGDLEGVTQTFLSKVAKSGIKPAGIDLIWVEPKLIPDKKPDWMREADFSDAMFKRLKASVSRPGVGVVTDSLIHSVKTFCFREDNNLEMRKNAQSLQKMDLGRDCGSIDDAYAEAQEYVKNDSASSNFLDQVRTLNFNGAEEAAHLILG